MTAFPALFFYSGGNKGGMVCYFMIAIIFTSFILEKNERIFALILEFILYTACCLFNYYKPELTFSISSEHMYFADSIINFLTASILLLLAIMLRTRISYINHERIQELNRELEARSETLMRYNKMKGDFLGTVAHEINTPLAIIAASSQDTLDILKASPLNLDEVRENQKIIGNRVKLIDSILLDLMDTVAIENGRLPLKRQPIKMKKFLKAICDAQFYQTDVNNNNIMYEMQPNLQDIWIDPMRIEQVVTNLLSNAMRYTKEGTIKIRLFREDDKQIVCISDNGEGMDAEVAQVALKQYVSTKTDYWRHGIGLNVCRNIIAAHGGDIWIESEKGHGTSIYFSFKEDEGDE